jgi:hypothetical protein
MNEKEVYNMIFLSHNSKNKNLVEPLFLELRSELPDQQFFYDEHSIQPGESIVGKMSEGLGQNSIFFLFWSDDASKSKMVEREWQSALSKSVVEGSRLIVVKLDRTPLPTILSDFKYLDFYSDGYKSTYNAMKKIIAGENTFVPKHLNVSNLVYKVTEIIPLQKWSVRYEAAHSVEYGLTYFVASRNIDNVDIGFDPSGISMGGSGTITIGDETFPARTISTMHSFVSPGKPDTIIVSIKDKEIPTEFFLGVDISGNVRIIGKYQSYS